ncbi:hypothetical protein J6590_060130, partial [Homalodisca vitripennis]
KIYHTAPSPNTFPGSSHNTTYAQSTLPSVSVSVSLQLQPCINSEQSETKSVVQPIHMRILAVSTLLLLETGITKQCQSPQLRLQRLRDLIPSTCLPTSVLLILYSP